MLDFNVLSLKNHERCGNDFKQPINSWNTMEWACAVAGETGEMCNFAKKLERIKMGIEPDKSLTEGKVIADIGKELADIVIYCDLLATSLNMRLGYLVKAKFNETSDKINSKIKL